MLMDTRFDETNGPLPVSTGHLPPVERVQALVDAAYERYKSNDEGHNADHYPALARVPREKFVLCVVGTNGATYAAGEAMVDMLVECRRIALLIIMELLFSVDFWIEYISPGAWVVFPKLPRLGYRKYLKSLDHYLYGIIQSRRNAQHRDDLLGHLIAAGLDDECIRDQMLTMLIAGHDPTQSLRIWIWALPIEEAVFFLFTAMIISFGLTSSLERTSQERWISWAGRLFRIYSRISPSKIHIEEHRHKHGGIGQAE